MQHMLLTSESVTEGHPDKVCDQISDAILDNALASDANSRVACETAITTNTLIIMGEITSSACIEYENVARNVLRDIGYTAPEIGISADDCNVITVIDEQSSDIALGVNQSLEKKAGESDECSVLGAGDQGMVYGYACDETPELMPLGLTLSHQLVKRLTQVRKNGDLKYLRPDGKSQVTVEYQDGVPKRIDTVVVSAQHADDTNMDKLRKDIFEKVISPTLPRQMIDKRTKILVNPTGKFSIGGPRGDSGLTGRKIIVDTYGGYARHGGGAFSGKDPTKVDRSAAYMARYIAKNIVAARLAKKCEVQISYAIGVAEPVSVMVDTFGTGECSNEQLLCAIKRVFDMRPQAIIEQLNLRNIRYRFLASYGHMGREDLDVAWERIDKVPLLLQNLRPR